MRDRMTTDAGPIRGNLDHVVPRKDQVIAERMPPLRPVRHYENGPWHPVLRQNRSRIGRHAFQAVIERNCQRIGTTAGASYNIGGHEPVARFKRQLDVPPEAGRAYVVDTPLWRAHRV